MARFDVRTGALQIYDVPAGWQGQPIRDTGILLLLGPEGQMGIRRPGEEAAAVLAGCDLEMNIWLVALGM